MQDTSGSAAPSEHDASRNKIAPHHPTPITNGQSTDKNSPDGHGRPIETCEITPNKNNELVSPQLRRTDDGATKERLTKEVEWLTKCLSKVSAAAAQACLQKNWRLFLFEPHNDWHLSFIMKAGLKNANARVIGRVLKEPGIITRPLIDGLSEREEVIQAVFENAINSEHHGYLDKAIVTRMKTMSPMQLIKLLAETDRLGYTLDDVMEDEEDSAMTGVQHQQESENSEIGHVCHEGPGAPSGAPPQSYVSPYDWIVAESGQKAPNSSSSLVPNALVDSQLRNDRTVPGTSQPWPVPTSQGDLVRPQAQSAQLLPVTNHQWHQNDSRQPPTQPLPMHLPNGQSGVQQLVCHHCNEGMPTARGYNYVSLVITEMVSRTNTL